MTSAITTVSYVMLAVYFCAVSLAGMCGAFRTMQNKRRAAKEGGGSGDQNLVKEHFTTVAGLSTLVWFFTMSASLFSGYTVSGIVAESYNLGFVSTRWIPAGVGVYAGFMFLAPRLHALGKSRRYMTVNEFIFDRYSAPGSGAPWVAHALRLVSFFALQLPVFTYLITQFQAVGLEVRTFTNGEISSTAAVLIAAAVLLVCDLLGGMRAVAFTDVVQGVVLLVGSIIFLVIQKTSLGGLPAAAGFYRDPSNAKAFALMTQIPSAPTIVAYFDFCFKTSIAATMFPHLSSRLFAARDSTAMRRGMAMMPQTFFIIQLSSMITGWVAIAALASQPVPKGTSIFSAVLLKVAAGGVGQAVVSALLLAAAICAMMSTADSALLAFSSMWVRDLYTVYLRPRASEREQIMFGRCMSCIGLAIGVLLGLLTIERGVPNLTGLFSLQNVTPIHVFLSVALGLHWRSLRGEAPLAGMVVGLAVTIGLLFSPVNVALSKGLDQTACGLSTALIGFFVNLVVTVSLGVLFDRRPQLLDALHRLGGARLSDGNGKVPAADEASPSFVDVGTSKCGLVHQPALWAAMVALLLFATPFYRPPGSPDSFVGDIASWAFVALLLSGVLGVLVAMAYLYLWMDWSEPGLLPQQAAGSNGGPQKELPLGELGSGANAAGGGADSKDLGGSVDDADNVRVAMGM